MRQNFLKGGDYHSEALLVVNLLLFFFGVCVFCLKEFLFFDFFVVCLICLACSGCVCFCVGDCSMVFG